MTRRNSSQKQLTDAYMVTDSQYNSALMSENANSQRDMLVMASNAAAYEANKQLITSQVYSPKIVAGEEILENLTSSLTVTKNQ